MLSLFRTPLIRLSNLFPKRAVFAKCEQLAPSGCFKIRGATNLLEYLRQAGKMPQLIVPSMGNTALGAAVGAAAYGFRMVGVVPTTIARAKDEKLRALGVELIKVDGGGSELLKRATELAKERDGYFVHPHLDPHWTDGYQVIAEEVLRDLPYCKALVFPLGGGGLLMGLTEFLARRPAAVKLIGCEPCNYPKYADGKLTRTQTIADGLRLEHPHPAVQKRIRSIGVAVPLVDERAIHVALADLFATQGLLVEPSAAVPLAHVQTDAGLEEPICIILTGENIAREDFFKLIET